MPFVSIFKLGKSTLLTKEIGQISDENVTTKIVSQKIKITQTLLNKLSYQMEYFHF